MRLNDVGCRRGRVGSLGSLGRLGGLRGPIGEREAFELPLAPPAPYTGARDGVPQGTMESIEYAPEAAGAPRKLWIYTPPGYAADGGSYPLALCFDGYMYSNEVQATFDNGVLAVRIPVAENAQPRKVEIAIGSGEMAQAALEDGSGN